MAYRPDPAGPQNLREMFYWVWGNLKKVGTAIGDTPPDGGYPNPPDPAPDPPPDQPVGAHSHYLDNLINVDVTRTGGGTGVGANAVNLLNGHVLTFRDDLNYWENATVASEAFPTGLIDGGELNIGPGVNDIEVLAGLGVIIDSYTDPDAPPQAKAVSWNQINQPILQTPAAGQLAFFTIIPASPEVDGPVTGTILGELKEYDTTAPPQENRRDEIPLGLVVHNGDVWGEISSPTVINNSAHTLEDYLNSVSGPSFIIEGGEITEELGHQINQSSGTVWEQNRNWHVNKKSPHRETFTARTPLQFRYTNRDFSTVGTLGSTVDVTQWDDGGTVSPIGGGSQQATIQRVYIDPRDNVWILWGQNIYPSYAEAVSKIGSDTANTEVPAFLAGTSILLCYVVSRQNQTDWGSESTIVIPEGGSGGGGSPFTPTTFTGALTTGYVPDPLTESERTLIDDGTWQNRVHAKTYVAGNNYYPQDMVYEGGWLMVANAETTDNPEPQPVGDPTWSLPDVPAFQEFSDPSVIYSGHLYTFTVPGYFRGARIWVPELSGTTNYRVIFVRNPNSANPTYNALPEPVLVEDEWVVVGADTILVGAGEELLVYLDSYNQGAETFITGGWQRAVNSNDATLDPGLSQWGTNNAQTLLRISDTDLDTVDRSTELTGVIAGSTFEIVDTVDPQKSVTYRALANPIDQTTHFSWTVEITNTGVNGVPAVADICTLNITVPVAQATRFVGIDAYWVAGTTMPSWATVTSFLQYDGVDQPVQGDEAYGVDILFQELTKSDDWDVYGLPDGGGGGGSGGGGLEPHVISYHDDVDTVTQPPIVGDVLTWDGTNWTSGSGPADRNIDGGPADAVYLPSQRVDGGSASG